MVVLRPAMLGAGAHPDPVLPSYRGTTTGQRSSSAPGPLPHLFWHHDGEPFANVSSRFALFVREVAAARNPAHDFRPFRFHDLRHRYAVEYLKNGGGLYDLQHQLGHSSVKVTELYLAYLTPEEVVRDKDAPAQNPAHV